MMVIPLPYEVLDLLISLNLSVALVVLLSTLNVSRPLDFSSFPSLLLITTLFRLALNVSSARLILLNGFAGYVINAFGSFVVGGNILVGVIVFIILVVIQYIVITRGAERVSEVAARFTLDAMPGKQMAIDADLNAGVIDDAEARRRRQEIQREADFYGAMDGASKFVRGDAIAGMVILAVNIVGGLVVGVAMNGMPIQTALQRYTILTVGDGLVSQIPALLLSTATGLIVTRSSAQGNLASLVSAQVFQSPRPLYLAAGALGVFGLVPGLPLTPLWALGALFFFLGRVVARHERKPEPPPAPKPAATASVEELTQAMKVDPVSLELGLGLLSLAQEEGPLLARVSGVRRQIAQELGLIVPPVRIKDNLELPSDGYALKLRGVTVGEGVVKVGWFLAIDPTRSRPEPQGVKTTEPVFGLPAHWVSPEQRLRLEAEGFTVVDAPTVITTHLSEVLRQNAPELLSRQEVQRMLDDLRKEQPAVVEDVLSVAGLGDIQKVLRALLAERVSIRDLPVILEAIADAAREGRDLDLWVSRVRQALARVITRDVGLGRRAKAITLSAEAEAQLAEAISAGQVDAAAQQALVRSVSRELQRHLQEGREVVLLCSARVRPAVRRALERTFPRLPVLAFSEVAPGVEVETVGVVAL
jgi:flagellar biosynthesis protein FlhA